MSDTPNLAPETLELLAAIHAVSLRHKRHIANGGKEGYLQLLEYVGDASKIKAAIAGIEKILPELTSLKPEGATAVASAMSDILDDWGVPHRAQDITSEVIKDLADLIPVLQEVKRRWDKIMGLPPAALPA